MATNPLPKIEIRYLRAPNITELPVDGIFGAVSTSGQVMMAVYTERLALPETASVNVIRDPQDSEKLTVDERQAMPDHNERIIHTVLHFDVELAKTLKLWLEEQIASHERNKND